MADKANQVEFSPATPIPLVIDTKARIKELQCYLDPNNPEYEPERQHVNIRAAIKLYEEGKIDGIQRTTIIDGKIVPFEDVVKSKAAFWIGGTFFQQAQNYHILMTTTTIYQQPEVDNWELRDFR
ncbi:hypothetical protein VE02_09206 [Pseudogymnoascus sp. 03VT05]|nr:hypothetical protein VE02_09206 [Pseudogymnoascus sp. 03VT05]